MQSGLQIKQREFPRISLLFEPWKAWGCGVFVHTRVVTHSPVRPCFLWQSPGRRRWLAPSSLSSWNPCWPSRPPSKQESRRIVKEHTKVEYGKGGRMDDGRKFRTNTELEGKKQVFLDIWPWGSKGQTLTRSAQKIYTGILSFLWSFDKTALEIKVLFKIQINPPLKLLVDDWSA